MSTHVAGTYRHRGWVVEVGPDAGAEAVTVASIHEAMHDRLQMTTLFGCTVALMREKAIREASPILDSRADSLQLASTRVHEEFATWMSAVPAGWNRGDLEATFPVYARHLARAQARVRDLPGAYLAMHAVQAIARACMQPATLVATLEANPIEELSFALLDRTMRPDWRLARLESALDREGWGPLTGWLGDAHSLSLDRFAEHADPGWAEVNQAAYDWCQHLLAASGCPTLPYDGHLPAVRRLRSQIGVAGTDAHMPSAAVALMSVESETLSLEDPLEAVILPPATPAHELMAGSDGRAHLFLAIRPRARVLAQYATDLGSLTPREHVAVLRCQRSDGTVELLDVTMWDEAAVKAAGPVVVSISMSSLADPAVADQWRGLLGRHQASVLCDLRPSVNLEDWLKNPGFSLRYAIVGVEGRVGTVRFLVFELDHDGRRSRKYLAPVSQLYDAGLRLWLAESPGNADKVREDQTLAADPLFRFSAAHILLEERLFDFTGGDPHG